MILSIITDRGWVFVDYIYIGRANLLQLIFIISFSLHAKALLVKTVRAVLLNMYWTPITVTVNLVFSELTANEEVFWKFIFFPDAKAKLKRCSWKYLICYLKPEKEIISCMEATRALDSPYLNLFTRWLRSVVLKSLKAVKQKFLLKKNCGEILRSREWSDLAWSKKIQFSLSSCNAFQTRTSNKYAAQLSMVPDGLNARKSQIFTELQQRNFLRMPGVGQYF